METPQGQTPRSFAPEALIQDAATAMEETAELLRGFQRLRRPQRVDWVDHCGTLPYNQYGVSCARCEIVVASGFASNVIDAPATRAAMAAHTCPPESAEQVQARERKAAIRLTDQYCRSMNAVHETQRVLQQLLAADEGARPAAGPAAATSADEKPAQLPAAAYAQPPATGPLSPCATCKAQPGQPCAAVPGTDWPPFGGLLSHPHPGRAAAQEPSSPERKWDRGGTGPLLIDLLRNTPPALAADLILRDGTIWEEVVDRLARAEAPVPPPPQVQAESPAAAAAALGVLPEDLERVLVTLLQEGDAAAGALRQGGSPDRADQLHQAVQDMVRLLVRAAHAQGLDPEVELPDLPRPPRAQS